MTLSFVSLSETVLRREDMSQLISTSADDIALFSFRSWLSRSEGELG